MKRLLACIFHPPSGESEPERLVDAGREAAARDLISILRAADIEPLLVSAASRENAGRRSDLEIEIVETDGGRPFHFGESLKRLIRDRRPNGLLYFGSGSGFLLSHEQVLEFRDFARRDASAALLNNFYSCDYAAISEVSRVLGFNLPRTDNPLGLVLADAGVPCFALKRSAETQFDIDTPTDLLVLQVSERGGPAIRSFVDDLELSHPFLPKILGLLSDRTALVHFLGRVSPRTWTDIERQIACRTGGSIEGRGMRTGASVHPPFLQKTLREEGDRVFFRRLSQACDGAVIDTRPLLADEGWLPEADVRFASDLLRPEAIRDPRWRSFTEAALDAEIPVLLGGHSIVSGGLYLLADACWKGRDLPRRLHPEPFDLDKERS